MAKKKVFTKKKVAKKVVVVDVKEIERRRVLNRLPARGWFVDWYLRQIGISSFEGQPGIQLVVDKFLALKADEDIVKDFKEVMEKDGYVPKIWKVFTHEEKIEVEYEVNIADLEFADDPEDAARNFDYSAEHYDENVRVLGVMEIM